MSKRCPICAVVATPRGPVSVCPGCTHIWQTDLRVKAVYDADYIHQRYDAYDTTAIMSYLRAGYLRAHVPLGPLLDVGYGNGAFLKAATACGYEGFGADVHGCDYGIVEHPLVSEQTYRGVTFFDSLEHFPDFAPVRDLAQRTDYIVISYPCRPTWFPDDKEWKHYRPGEHLHYFSTRSLCRLFQQFTLVSSIDLEDAVRGKLSKGEQNIQTLVLKRRS